VLPKNLRKAVKHLSDGELDLLHAATLEEMGRRGTLPPIDQTTNRSSRKEKSSHGRQVEAATVSLTRGQVNAVRAAFKAGIKPSIARQFGISQSDVRKVLAMDASARGIIDRGCKFSEWSVNQITLPRVYRTTLRFACDWSRSQGGVVNSG